MEESLAIENQKRWQNKNYQAADNRSKFAGKANIECFKSHKYDHYRYECHANMNRESSNFAEHNEKNDDSSLFMVCHPKEVSKNVWYLDTSCSSHMCGDKSAFSDLDESCQDKVKFGDNSTIAVKGKGKEFWPEAVNWSVYILNKSPTSPLLDRTLEEASSERRPAVDYFRIFGCIAYAHVPDQKRSKLDDKGEKCIFLGVSDRSKTYRIYNPLTKKVIISSDVVFDEASTCSWIEKSRGQISVDFENGKDLTMQNSKGQTKQIGDCDPLTYEEAIKEEKWQKAVAEEIGSIERNQTWKLTDLLEGHKTIGGYKQEFGIDYQEVFAPVARMNTIRLVIALAAQNSWPIHQLDVKSAFLHGTLQEHVLIDQPPGYVKSSFEHKELLDRFQMKNCNSVTTPVDKGVKLVKDLRGRFVDNKLYKYMEHPKELHLHKRILSHLRGTIDFGLFYKKGDQIDHAGFTDSDFAGDLDNKKSTSGFVFMLGSGVVSWSSKKQSIVTLSTTKVEYVAATSCACQAIWLRRVLEELELNQHEATSIYCDNSSAIKLSRNLVLHGKSKHIHESESYKTLIRQHVDLQIIQSRLEKGLYSDCTAKFFRDLLLLFNNITIFYHKSSQEHIAAQELQKLVCKEMMTLLPTKPVQEPATSVKFEPDKQRASLSKPTKSSTMVACGKHSSIKAITENDSKKGDKKEREVEEKPKANEKKVDGSLVGIDEKGIRKKRSKERSVTGQRNSRTSNKSGEVKHEFGGNELSSHDTLELKTDKQESVVRKKQGAASFLRRMKQNSPSEVIENDNEDNDSEDQSKDGKGEEEKKQGTTEVMAQGKVRVSS
ncbi:hypothetical protein SLEP1_g30775 [Rubroshorea leprosula]|uniref:Bromo domain-containing protein n=1 Tax=Rubroshorea leprosula TaxID=152421 RepID=A0AAV5K9E6_9ROSI|nr:hypothetical protein SLEP1_g30775 [Rubroshorea leprosula]